MGWDCSLQDMNPVFPGLREGPEIIIIIIIIIIISHDSVADRHILTTRRYIV